MRNVSLLGCGKLGFPLGIKLLEDGFNVKGSTTTVQNLQKFIEIGIEPYVLDAEKQMDSNFFKSDILVLTLPFKKNFEDPHIYKKQIQRVCSYVEPSPIKHIVFTSSSSVYPKDGLPYEPYSDFIPPNKRAEVLLSCEQIILNIPNISVRIIRLGGICRDEGKYKSSSFKRRLITQKDSIKLIKECVHDKSDKKCINGFKII